MSISKTLVVIAITLGPVVLLIMSLSLSTNFWVTYTVDRTKLTNLDRKRSETNASLSFFHSRSKGIFRECINSKDAFFLEKNPGGDCINIVYEPPGKLKLVASQAYWNRLHLMRCHFAFLILGLSSFLVAYMIGVVLCCQKRPLWAKSSGVFAYLSAFASAASVAFFHGVEYIERSVIDSDLDGFAFYARWPKELQDGTIRKYDWSYILCWAGAVLAAICGTLYVVAAWLIQNERKNEDSRKVLPKRFLAEHNAGPAMMGDVGPYQYDDPQHGKYFYPGGYLGPYMYEMNERGYPAYNGDSAVWQWQ